MAERTDTSEQQDQARIAHVGVVGCGTMGAGIAELIATHGIPVTVLEVDDGAVAAGQRRITASLERQVRRERLTPEQRDDLLERIQVGTDPAALGACDLVVEAVPEVLALKQDVFRLIDAHARADAIIATNTSSLPVMDIAVVASRPNRVLGFHFFNPAPVMRLIELVRTVVTDEAVVEVARRFAEEIGKVPVVVGDRRGFIANQLLFPYLNQAVWMVEGGYATKEDVDTAMRLGTGLPMGPIALTDLVGLDTFVGIMNAIHAQFDDPRNAPRPILSQLASAGFTGRKAGRGFYRYEEAGTSRVVAEDQQRSPADPELVAGWGRVGVIGTGTMATGIAEVCARAGFAVALRGRSAEKAATARDKVARSLGRQVERGRLDAAERDEILARISPVDDLGALAGCDVVIEAVAEDLAVKQELFRALDEVLAPDAVLATTTSSLPVIDCAMATARPERVLGLHFFNPAAVMRLVEVVTTVRTDAEVVELARGFVARVGKTEVLCGDRAGFIVNTLLFPYLNDAVRMLDSHYATAEEIDTAMKLGCGYPMGPFELMDVVGLDVTLAILERLHEEYRQPAMVPAPLLRHLVETGFLGRKAGRGFYVYA
ncbi:MAG: 3-hydroxyacyl-CoA dehydrogenase family protein [Nitriliruptoraceae bacterium]